MNDSDEPRSGYRMVSVVAAWAAGMTMIGLIVGGGAEQLANAVSAPANHVAAADHPEFTESASSSGVDYTSTGAIKGQPALNPCQR